QSKSTSINTQTEISTLPSIKEHEELILFTNETEQMDINDNTESITKKLELQNIQNPLKTKTKGRSLTKRYKSSVKIEQGNSRNTKSSSNHNTYKCRICGQLSHNAAYHKKGKDNILKEHDVNI
ncbi:4403_t:CDS:1, partial [Funneliformis mosseae]